MTNGIIALFLGLGVAGWAYSKLAKQTGNANPSSVLISAGFIGFIVAIITFTLFKFVFHFS